MWQKLSSFSLYRNMASFTKHQPILQGEELYIEWKQDIEIWSQFTDLLKEKQGPQYFCTALRTYVNWFHIWVWYQLSAQQTGYESLQNKLNKVQLCDEHMMVYKAFKDIYSYKSTTGVICMNFCIKNKFRIILPKEVQAFLFRM